MDDITDVCLLIFKSARYTSIEEFLKKTSQQHLKLCDG